MDLDHRTRSFGALGGRIILLGDGTELSSDSADPDSEMFDHDDEDLDLESQVKRSSAEENHEEPDANVRRQREGTPAPSGNLAPGTSGQNANDPDSKTEASPSSVSTERSQRSQEADSNIEDPGKGGSADETPPKAASDSASSSEHQEAA